MSIMRVTETEEARAYWRDRKVNDWYVRKTAVADHILEAVSKLDPIQSVFEFGCGTGHNLHFLKQRYPYLSAEGIDVNPQMIEIGRRLFNVDIFVGDERDIRSGRSFDLVFTASVMDHIPYPRPVLEDLVEISRRYLILFEPWTGKVERVDNEKSPARFTYSWDYDYMLKNLNLKVLERKLVSIYDEGMGPYYHIWVARK